MNAKQKRSVILFVDDEKICHTLAELIIPNFTNFHLVNAFNAKEALELATRHVSELALVITDIILPGISGYELFETFKKDDKFAKIPFIFQSGLEAQDKVIEKYINDNVKILCKPYKQADLLAVIDEMTGSLYSPK